jgi:hypothetical protein
MLLVFLLLIIIVPSTGILLLLWLITRKSIFGKIAGALWLGLISLIGLFCILSVFTSKKEIDKDDIYGEYIIDRNKCAGKQADWQYNHYRFEIREDNKIFFYITENERIIKTIEGTVEIKEYYTPSPRLKINFDDPRFHVVQDNPTLYREIWSFYYVFYSDKFDNMFFTKGTWSSID